MNLFRRPEQHAARVSAAALLAAGLVCTAWAQGPTDGALAGRVADSSGRPLAGATVSLSAANAGSSRVLSVQPDGTWLMPGLAPGAYTLTVALPGFATARFSPVQVTLGQTLALDAALRPTLEPETIEVTPVDAAAPADGVEEAIAEPALALLPSANKRWQEFALTVPGVTPDEDADGLAGVHGLPSTQNALVIDGADATQAYHSIPDGSGSDPAPSPDDDADAAELTTGPANGLARGRRAGAAYGFARGAVREFRVGTPGYSAQTGRAAGAVVTTASRSGADSLHGSLGLTLRASPLAAKNPLAIATSYAGGVVSSAVMKPHDLRETFVLALGGPVPRLHVLPSAGLRFFYALDVQRHGFPAVSSPADPNFYRLTANQRALLGNRGLTPAQVDEGLTYLSSLTGPVNRRADQTIHFGRLDWGVRPRLTLTAEYNRTRWNSPGGLLSAPVVARGRASLGNSSGSLDTVLLRVSSVLTPRTVNELRLVFARDLQYESPQPNLPQEPAIGPAGVTGLMQAPEVVIGPNGLLFGTPASLARQAFPDEVRYQAAETLTLARGHHVLALGGDAVFVEDRVATLANPAGTFRYDSGETRGYAGGLVDFLSDRVFNVNANPNGACPSIFAAAHLFCFRSFTQGFGLAQVNFHTAAFAGFVEDTWRPSATLSLHAGLRYDYLLLPKPQRPNPTLDAFFAARGATSIFPEDRNNFGPRVSAAWQPFGWGTLHAGYGLFYGRLPGAMLRAALTDTSQTAGTTRIRITPATVTACPQVANQGFGYPCAFLTQPAGVVSTTTSSMVFDRHFRLPAIQQGSLSFERALGERAAVSVGGVMNLDRQLPATTDLNIAPATRTMTYRLLGGTGQPGVRDGDTFVLPLYTARLVPTFGPVTQIRSSANASYYALIASLSARPVEGLSIWATYTWSKALDYGASASGTPRTDSQLDPYVNGYDKGRSALDYPHQAHMTAAYAPHVTLEHAWLRRALERWELGTVIAVRSGRPYSYDLFGGTRLNGGHTSLNGSGGALYLPTVGRNTQRLPVWVNADLRVARTIPLGGAARLRASAEAYNLFNHRNVTSVVQRAYLVGALAGGVTPLTFQSAAAIAAAGLNTQAFGTPTASGSGLSRERQLQFSLMAEF